VHHVSNTNQKAMSERKREAEDDDDARAKREPEIGSQGRAARGQSAGAPVKWIGVRVRTVRLCVWVFSVKFARRGREARRGLGRRGVEAKITH
jgi:hypothetical protein